MKIKFELWSMCRSVDWEIGRVLIDKKINE